MAEHPVVTLLVKRMESHPAEFLDQPLRWESIIGDVRMHSTPEDRDVLQAALSRVCMDRLHEQVMDELLNGEERRVEAERQRLEKIEAARAQAHAQAQSQGVISQAQQNLKNYMAQSSNINALQGLANAFPGLKYEDMMQDAVLTGTSAIVQNGLTEAEIRHLHDDYEITQRRKKRGFSGLLGKG